MGSSQSHPTNDEVTEKIISPSSSSSPPPPPPTTTTTTTSKPKRTKPPKNESGYSRATRVCNKKKRAYDACYTAQLSSKEEDCDDLFETYRTCFLRVIAKDMEKRGVKVSENSMIGEYKDETADDESG
mmetsp:Transcript_11547/g.17503  ORF Transcript_11547/g.17503 Transcript_11547/m.17503 type:complete len:128 (+) Transcript_11547:197-580(+)